MTVESKRHLNPCSFHYRKCRGVCIRKGLRATFSTGPSPRPPSNGRVFQIHLNARFPRYQPASKWDRYHSTVQMVQASGVDFISLHYHHKGIVFVNTQFSAYSNRNSHLPFTRYMYNFKSKCSTGFLFHLSPLKHHAWPRRNLSALTAAMAPSDTAVTICRRDFALTSPAAKRPGVFVAMFSLVMM